MSASVSNVGSAPHSPDGEHSKGRLGSGADRRQAAVSALGDAPWPSLCGRRSEGFPAGRRCPADGVAIDRAVGFGEAVARWLTAATR